MDFQAANPIGATIAAIGLQIIAITELIQHWHQVVSTVKWVGSELVKVFDWAMSGMLSVNQQIVAALQNSWAKLKEWIKDAFDWVIGMAKRAVGITVHVRQQYAANHQEYEKEYQANERQKRESILRIKHYFGQDQHTNSTSVPKHIAAAQVIGDQFNQTLHAMVTPKKLKKEKAKKEKAWKLPHFKLPNQNKLMEDIFGKPIKEHAAKIKHIAAHHAAKHGQALHHHGISSMSQADAFMKNNLANILGPQHQSLPQRQLTETKVQTKQMQQHLVVSQKVLQKIDKVGVLV